MKGKKMYGILSLFLIGIVATTGLVSAYGFRDQASQEAIENGDFDAWKEARMNMLTEENFEEMSQRHQERSSMHESREAMRAAIENNDYEAWKEIAQGLDRYPVDVETIDESDFETLVEMHQAKMAGNHEEAKSLAEELGFESQAQGMRGGKGMRGGFDGMKGAFVAE